MAQENYKLYLKSKFVECKATIAIVGLGYVGLPLAINYAKKGFKIIGLDSDENKILQLNNRSSYINHISNQLIRETFKDSKAIFSTNFELIENCDAVIICVPTPLTKYRSPDLTFINSALNKIKPFLTSEKILSLESTTYPGTTEELILPFVKKLGFNVGEDFFIVYSPEREDPGNKSFSTSNIPKVLGGITKNCAEVGKELYSAVIEEIIIVTDTKTAEMTKLLENIHRSVNIGLVNELKPLANEMSIDIFEVIRAAATKPFGFVPYYPGPGLGGHCIPIDPFYLSWKAKEFGMNTKFIELAGEINSGMHQYVIKRIQEALNFVGLSVKNSNALILGMAYKKNIDDFRESPSFPIIKSLSKLESKVSYNDPYVNECHSLNKYLNTNYSIDINKENLEKFDVVILVTDHDNYDYQLIFKYSKLIVDCRGKFQKDKKVFSS
mgnify:CR=1 FL=1|tara:strand:+ start:1177 stop:2496 length:1320 start_codon:yes stop_codon:yes gene_type:complete